MASFVGVQPCCPALPPHIPPSPRVSGPHATPLQIACVSARHGVIATDHHCREGMREKRGGRLTPHLSPPRAAPLLLHIVLNNNRARIDQARTVPRTLDKPSVFCLAAVACSPPPRRCCFSAIRCELEQLYSSASLCPCRDRSLCPRVCLLIWWSKYILIYFGQS